MAENPPLLAGAGSVFRGAYCIDCHLHGLDELEVLNQVVHGHTGPELGSGTVFPRSYCFHTLITQVCFIYTSYENVSNTNQDRTVVWIQTEIQQTVCTICVLQV